jgi:hypothetical protein
MTFTRKMIREHPSLLASSSSRSSSHNSKMMDVHDGQSYEELVNNNNNGGHSNMDESGYDLSDDEDNFNNKGRVSNGGGGFMLGRNSLSNWTTIGGNDHDDDDEENEGMMEDIGHLNTGRKSNVTSQSRRKSSETPLMGQLINVSSRYTSGGGRGRSTTGGRSTGAGGRRRSTNPLNISHISSSSSSNDGTGYLDESSMLMKDDTWSPIRSSLDNSFANSGSGHDDDGRGRSGGGGANMADASRRASRSLSPGRRCGGARSSRSCSPSRSPLGDISPNRRGGEQKMKKKSSTSMLKSPDGTFSLKEASPSLSSAAGGGGRRKSLSFPSLSSTRKSIGFSPVVGKTSDDNINNNAGNSEGTTTATTEEVASSTTIRSPIPTPNSQRRLVKRFRASVPTANYMEPEEIEKETAAAAPTTNKNAVDLLRRFERNASLSTNAQQQQQEYKNEFVFPESIGTPSAETLLLAHNQATSVGSGHHLSHQYQLTRAGTNLLSLQEVILPSILTETSTALKEKQAKAQRNVKDGLPDSQGKDVVEVIEACRKLVNRCIGEAMKDAGESWRQREERRAQSRIERHTAHVEQCKANEVQAKRLRKEQRAQSRQMKYESAKREATRMHPRNKAMWSELANLELALQKLKADHRQWMQVKKDVDRMDATVNSTTVEKMDLDPVIDAHASGTTVMEQVGNTALEHTATTMVEDVTMAMNRLNWVFTSVSSAMEESDKLRTEAFTKYQTDHKMIGFSQFDDPKDLFRMVSRKSIGGTPART